MELSGSFEFPPQISSQMLSRTSKEGWLVIFSGFSLHILLGSLFFWGDLMIYIYSYLRQYDPNISLMSISMIFPFTYLLFQIVMTQTEYFANKYSLMKLASFGLLIFLGSLFLASMTQTFIIFALIYVIGIGFSLGLLYMLPIMAGLRYFPQNQNRVIGLIQIGGAFGVVFIGVLSHSFINFTEINAEVYTQTNIYFNECVANQIPKFLKILVVSYLIFGLVSLSYLQFPQNSDEKTYSKIERNANNFSKLKILGLLALFTLLSMEGFFFLIFYKVIGLGKLYNDIRLLWEGIGGISLIWLTKVPWNFFNCKVAIVLMILLQILGKIFIFNEWSFSIALVLEFISLGGILSLTPKIFINYIGFSPAKSINKIQSVLFGLSSIFICFFKEYLVTLKPSFFICFFSKDVTCLFIWIILMIVIKNEIIPTEKNILKQEMSNKEEYMAIDVKEGRN